MLSNGRSPGWIGVDLGTGSVKARLVDTAGTTLARAERPLTDRRPTGAGRRDAGRHEQSPSEWVEAAFAVIADVAGAGVPEAIAVCSTSGTIAVLGSGGVPIGPGLMYDDARAADLAGEVAAADAEYWRRLGYLPQGTWALPKIVWLHREGLLPRGSTVAHQADVVTGALCGAPAGTDTSHSLKSGYDLRRGRWPDELLRRLGLDPSVFPDVHDPGERVGGVDGQVARRLGLPAGIPVVAGMTDGCASVLGSGAMTAGDGHSELGTTLVVKRVTGFPVSDPARGVYSHRAPEPGTWLPGGASNIGAGAFPAVLPGADLAALDAAFDPESEPVLCYPLTTTGERFPVADPAARGFLQTGGREFEFTPDGLDGVDDRTVYAGILYGVAFAERLAFEILAGCNDRGSGAGRSGDVRVGAGAEAGAEVGAEAGMPAGGLHTTSGGGTRSASWTRLRADVLDRPLTVPRDADAALGMAALAARSSGRSAVLTQSGGTPPGRVFTPSVRRRERIDDAYRRWLQVLTDKGWIGG